MSNLIKKYHVKVSFITPMLGTVPKNRELYTDFIKSKAPEDMDTEDEASTAPDAEELLSVVGTTFHMLNGHPIIYDYLVKGHFKAACSSLRRNSKSKSAGLKAHKKIIDQLVMVYPRQIPIHLNGDLISGKDLGIIERSLRVSGPKGERTCLSKSDFVPVGSSVEYEIKVLGGVTDELLKEWLWYGQFSGYGQWRSGSYGRFEYTLTK